MLNWVLRRRKGGATAGRGVPAEPKPDYETAKDIAANGSAAERAALARHEDLEPEILYYFASDDSPEVRRQVAENHGTPLQADLLLAEDKDEAVRAELAHKIGKLVPELTAEENERLAEMALEVLEILARDELPRVRAIIAEELKFADNVPEKIIRELAEDLEDIVSVPVLEYSPLLGERDLLEIVEKGLMGRRLLAVARRRDITEPVVDAVVATEDGAAVSAVVRNDTARISERTFHIIAEIAESDAGAQEAMVYRRDLPVRVILRIASFVNAALMETLMERHGQQKEVVEEIRRTVRERIERGELAGDELPFETASERAEREFGEGKLDKKRLIAALDDDDNAYARYAVFLLAGLSAEKGGVILNSGSPKAVAALAWKAGLDMSTAVRVQEQVCKFSVGKVMHPGPDGGYPMSQEDLEWYLESFLTG